MCRIDDADSDGRWVHKPAPRAARKEYTCGDCGRTIAKGETYTYAVWVEPDWGLTTVRMCAHCVAAGLWLRKVCGGHLWPGVVEELVEHWDEERHELGSFALGRLVILARARWQRAGQLVDVAKVTAIAQAAVDRVPVEARH